MRGGEAGGDKADALMRERMGPPQINADRGEQRAHDLEVDIHATALR